MVAVVSVPLAAVEGAPAPACICACAAVAPAVAAVAEAAAVAAAAAIAGELLEVPAAPEAAPFARSALTGMAVATGLSMIGGVPFWAAAAPESVAEALSADVLSVEPLSVDLPSSAFAVSLLLSLERDARVLPLEPAALLSSVWPRLDESVERLGGVGSVAAVVSRGDLSFAVSLAERAG